MDERDDSSDDEQISYLVPTGILPGLDGIEENRRGSTIGRTWINRDYDEAVRRLNTDDPGDTPKYSAEMFERRFRMSKSRFLRIYNRIIDKEVFVRTKDATG